MKNIITPMWGSITLLSIVTSSYAATLATDNFESYTTSIGGIWTATGGAGLYIHQNLNQPTDSTTFNYASGGNNAAFLKQSGGTITTTTFDLSQGTASDSITISFGFSMDNGSTTRRGDLEYSNDAGANWFQLVLLQTGGTRTNDTILSGSVTITEGSSTISRTGDFIGGNAINPVYSGAAFTNQSTFRIRNRGSAGGTGYKIFVDDINISTTAIVVPEPSTALFGLVGLTLLIRRRR